MTEFDLPAKAWFGKCKTSYALKEALIQYKESKEKNEEMIEFLCENILDNKEEFALFYPEFIRALVLCLPYNHKIVSCFIPDETAAKDFILFERKFKVYEGFPVNPYSVYYSNEIKLNMWGDFSDIFVSDLYPNLLQKLFTKIDEIVQEQAGFDHIIAEVFRKLLISALKLSKFDNLVSILANSGSVWKFVKMIFIDTIKNEYGEVLSQEATDVFTSVLKNKQYFISPIEGLVQSKLFNIFTY